MTDNMLNRDDVVTSISLATGYTKKDIKEILDMQDEVIARAIEEGYSIKHHKLFKLELEHQPKRKGWNGLEEKYYTIPEKNLLKFKPLSKLKNAIDNHNKNTFGD